MTRQLATAEVAERQEYQRRVNRSKQLLSALFSCLWITKALAHFYPKTLGGVFVPGYLLLIFAAWIYAAFRLGCPRCGLWRLWSKGGYCCSGCALRVGKQKRRSVRGSAIEREQRWTSLPRRRNVWKAVFPAFLVALLLTLGFLQLPNHRTAAVAGVALIGIVTAGVVTRLLLLRCPDCNRPLEGTRSENFCGACGAHLADQSASHPKALQI